MTQDCVPTSAVATDLALRKVDLRQRGQSGADSGLGAWLPAPDYIGRWTIPKNADSRFNAVEIDKTCLRLADFSAWAAWRSESFMQASSRPAGQSGAPRRLSKSQ